MDGRLLKSANDVEIRKVSISSYLRFQDSGMKYQLTIFQNFCITLGKDNIKFEQDCLSKVIVANQIQICLGL